MKHSEDDGVMLDDTEILLELQRRNKKYTLKWSYNGEGPTAFNEDMKPIPSDEVGIINQRFPISIFSQKQINNLSSNSNGLLRIIDSSSKVNRIDWQSR